MKNAFILFSFLLTISYSHAQQTLRGTVIDQQTLAPLPNAKVFLPGTEPLRGMIASEQGEFRFEHLPPGRYTLRVEYIGYEAITRANLVLTSAKELVLNIGLEEKVTATDEVVISATPDKRVALNEMSTVSARTFSVEEASRYAGSRNDPARMAQNFAGVGQVGDNRNDIIIRGNSPTGVLWRMEGIDIPNPNHFGAMGTTGGPVSMLNNNNLGNSDFMTSAFPAEYGNALAGVFDLNLRSGNNEQYEFMGQMGFNGFEAGVEGPFSKNSNASFLANYRYSTLGVFKALGINFGTGAAVPQYQDLVFKVDIPTKKAGRFVLFGMGGFSDINFLDSEAEDGGTNFYGGSGQDLYNKGSVGVTGISHTHLFSNTTYGKAIIAVSGIRSANDIDSLSADNGTPVRFYAESYTTIKYSASYVLNKKFNARNHLRMGAIFDRYDVRLIDSVRLADHTFRHIRDFSGQTGIVQAYAQWKHRFTDKLSLSTGLHYQQFMLNNSQALEPRLGLRYELNDRQQLNIGLGLHSQIQPLQTYFIQTRLPDFSQIQTNKELGFTRSRQAVLGYDHLLGPKLRLKAEAYYQQLYDAAVEQKASPFSMMNAGADFGFPAVDSLVNKGTGENYGVELTLEKFFSDQYYFLFTTSLFRSRYAGSDGITRSSAFDGNYIFNLLGGKEFQLGRYLLSIDLKLTVAGNRRYTPIDLEASRLQGETVRIDNLAFSEKYAPYIRPDLKITFRQNSKKITQEWSVDLNNVSNQQNVFSQEFDRETREIETTHQIGTFPVIQYRILF